MKTLFRHIFGSFFHNDDVKDNLIDAVLVTVLTVVIILGVGQIGHAIFG